MQTEVEEKDQKHTEQAVKGNSRWSCHEKVWVTMRRNVSRTKNVGETLPRNFKEKLKKERHCLYLPGFSRET